jgi:hypothetical protein
LAPNHRSARVRRAARASRRALRLRAPSRKSLLRKVAQLAAFPLVPAVFGAKVVREALKRPKLRAELPAALPYLAVFVHAWAVGETARHGPRAA